MQSKILGLCAATLFSAAAAAQCTDNLYPLRLVDGAGTPAPSAPNSLGVDVFTFPTEEAYVAFDPSLPSGTYYVHMIDAVLDGNDEVVSDNDPMDRIVEITNTGGVITLSLPFSSNSDPSLFGVGLNGQGQSLRLQYRQSVYTPCRFGVVMGNWWDLTNGPENPYLIAGGFNGDTGSCSIRSYVGLEVPNGAGSNVHGTVFLDSDRDGVKDPGEGPISGFEINLVTGDTTLSATTGADGTYQFPGVQPGTYAAEILVGSGYIVTTSAAQGLTVSGCGDFQAQPFGVAPAMLACDAKPVIYWACFSGAQKVHQYGILPTLPSLQIVNWCGQYVAPSNLLQWKLWMLFSNTWNMAFELSAQLAAMHCNVVTGGVDPACVLNDPKLGSMTVQDLMTQAIASLAAHPFTPVWHPQRLHQSRLKNALLRANLNLIWQ